MGAAWDSIDLEVIANSAVLRALLNTKGWEFVITTQEMGKITKSKCKEKKGKDEQKREQK